MGSGGRLVVVGAMFLVLGSWFLVLGGWFLVLGSWFLVVGGWWLVVGGWWLVGVRGGLIRGSGFRLVRIPRTRRLGGNTQRNLQYVREILGRCRWTSRRLRRTKGSLWRRLECSA